MGVHGRGQGGRRALRLQRGSPTRTGERWGFPGGDRGVWGVLAAGELEGRGTPHNSSRRDTLTRAAHFTCPQGKFHVRRTFHIPRQRNISLKKGAYRPFFHISGVQYCWSYISVNLYTALYFVPDGRYTSLIFGVPFTVYCSPNI